MLALPFRRGFTEAGERRIDARLRHIHNATQIVVDAKRVDYFSRTKSPLQILLSGKALSINDAVPLSA